MKNFIIVLGAFILAACGQEKNDADAECRGTEEESCGFNDCAGHRTCHEGAWSACSTYRDFVGDCGTCDLNGTPIYDCERCGDQDLDGYLSTDRCAGDDCVDWDAAINPYEFDACDGIDNNCDGEIDEDEMIEPCGSGDCAGYSVCMGGALTGCSSEEMNCGPCCVCDADGQPTLSCLVCEEGDYDECGAGECAGLRVCVDDRWGSCTSEGRDCGPCCVCDSEGNAGEICATCVEDDSIGCGEFTEGCSGRRWCAGDGWSDCDSVDRECGTCCTCDMNGNRVYSCDWCEDGDISLCGTDSCAGYRLCIGDDWQACSTSGSDCGECCECDADGNLSATCTTCEDGAAELCGSGACAGFRICIADSWSECSTSGRDCGDCCICDLDGNAQNICETCEEGDIRACGSGECLGIQVCAGDAWGNCSTVGDDCGTCCACSAAGVAAYDDAQDGDCPAFDCPYFTSCAIGRIYCYGMIGTGISIIVPAHPVVGTCTALGGCGHASCIDDTKICEVDDDSDGYSESCGDCDDTNPAVHSGLTEICGDFTDNDCDGTMEEGCCLDWDHDGHVDGACGGTDCNDSDAGVYPGAPADCTGRDADCDGLVDRDEDSDSYYGPVCGGTDCNDANASVYPGAPPNCASGQDADCDGLIDRDEDSDGYIGVSCGGADCDDGRASVYPGATEICNGLDDNCDGTSDNLAGLNIRHTTIRYVIPSSKCSTDPCCFYSDHREPGLAYSISISGLDFAAINPAHIYLTADVDRIYYSGSANSDARVEYRVNYSATGTSTQGYNFRDPRYAACGSLLTTPGLTNPLAFSSLAGNYPLSVEWWVPTTGDYGVALKNFSISLTMTCY